MLAKIKAHLKHHNQNLKHIAIPPKIFSVSKKKVSQNIQFQPCSSKDALLFNVRCNEQVFSPKS